MQFFCHRIHRRHLPQAFLLAMPLQIQLGRPLMKRVVQPFNPKIPTIYSESWTGLPAFSLLIHEFHGLFSLMVSRSVRGTGEVFGTICADNGFPGFQEKNRPTRFGLNQFSALFKSKILKIKNSSSVSLNRAVNTATYWWGFSGENVVGGEAGQNHFVNDFKKKKNSTIAIKRVALIACQQLLFKHYKSKPFIFY